MTPSPTATTPPILDDRIPLHHSRPAVVVHTALRREVRLAGPLVRRVDPGDLRRARVVGGHLTLVLGGLRDHHELEDERIWPPLRERAPVEVRPIVEVMQAQHDRIDALGRHLDDGLTSWTATADEIERDRLAELLDALHATLAEHLDLEERVVLPLAEQHLRADEWRAIGETAEARNRDHRVLTFGMLQHEGDRDVLAQMLSTAPLPVRILLPRLGRRAYRRHAIAVHGTATP